MCCSPFPAVPEAWGLGRTPRRVLGCSRLGRLLLGGRGTSCDDAFALLYLRHLRVGVSCRGTLSPWWVLLGRSRSRPWGSSASRGTRAGVFCLLLFEVPSAAPPRPQPSSDACSACDPWLPELLDWKNAASFFHFGAQVAALFPDALKAVSDTSWERVSGAGHAPSRCWQ